LFSKIDKNKNMERGIKYDKTALMNETSSSSSSSNEDDA
jgi:hypothetical protein